MKNQPVTASRSQSRQKKERGQGLVEFSLILPVLLLVIFGIIDYGRVLFILSDVSNSIRDGSRNATLVGTIGGVERYRACAEITSDAQNILFGQIQSFHILYYDTLKGDTALTQAAAPTYAANIEAASADDLATLATADFDCNTTAGVTDIGNDTTDSIGTGDLMVIVMEVRVEFLTPIMSSFVPGFDFQFRGQRTVVSDLQLQTSALDRDGDGLADAWEAQFFGCLLGDASDDPVDPPIAIQPDGTLIFADGDSVGWVPTSYTPGTSPLPASAPDKTSADSRSYPDDCALENVPVSTFYTDSDGDGVYDTLIGDPNEYAHYQCNESPGIPADTNGDELIEECIVPALELFTSVSDPDGDGLSNAAEAARGTEPIDIDNRSGIDSDGDGLWDLTETGAGTSNQLTDSDNDGIGDAAELCTGAADDGPDCQIFCASNTCYGTNPLNADTDSDGISDFDEIFNQADILSDLGYSAGSIPLSPTDGDSDGDGVADGTEINGVRLFGLVIDGVGQGGLLVNLNPTSDDTDGDGLLDGEEINGITFTNAIDGTLTNVVTNPVNHDTDGDGVCDSNGTGPGGASNLVDINGNTYSICDGSIVDVNPVQSDTDGDLLTDGEEQHYYQTDADNINSDNDVCGLDDGFELIDRTEDVDGDGLNNALDLNSDEDPVNDPTDGLGTANPTDCEEFALGIDPYAFNTDGDGDTSGNEWSDVFELARFCMNPAVPEPNTFDTTCNGEDLTADSDSDGIPDAWEIDNVGNLSQGADSDTDNDNCDLLCEFSRRTDPSNPDTDGDGIRDGFEVGTNPNVADTDGDGLHDGLEGAIEDVANPGTYICVDSANTGPVTVSGFALANAQSRTCYPTDPLLDDTDRDGILDGDEINGYVWDPILNLTTTTLPWVSDSDGDGIADGREASGIQFNYELNGVLQSNVLRYLNPSAIDTDNDGRSDFVEIFSADRNNTDPRDRDTDNDGLIDGTIASLVGEADNSYTQGLDGYGTDPNETDSDDDGLTDWQEIFPNLDAVDPDTGISYGNAPALNPYNITIDGASENRDVLGYDRDAPNSTVRLNPLNQDTDGDGLEDGFEMTNGTPDNQHLTDPLDPLTDGDDFTDGQEVNGGGLFGTNPVVTDVSNANDQDGDGLLASEETSFSTSDEDRDSDDDGLNDKVESDGISITYYVVRFESNSLVYQTVSTTVNTEGDSTTTNPFGYANGYDSDNDGLADSYEIYYADTSVLETGSGFDGTFQGDSGSCPYLENVTLSAPFIPGQPLNPILDDTDGDGLTDYFECNNNLNPFDARDGVALTDKITDVTLRQAVTFASGGDTESAAGLLDERLDGRVEVLVRRSDTGLLDLALRTACGPASTDGGTFISSVCGAFVDSNGQPSTTEPTNNGGDSSDDVITVYIAPSAVIEFLQNAGSNVISVYRPGEAPTGNQTPIAMISSVNCTGLTCDFDASGSVDNDGSITTYAWDFGDSSPAGSGVNPTHSYSADGTYTVSLTVTDNDGDTNTTSQTIDVVNNGAPIASFTDNCAASAPFDCTFDGSASSDSDGTIVSYAWDFGDGTTVTGATPPTHTYASAGLYTVTLTVTDNDNRTDVESRVINVGNVNAPPTASFTSACVNLNCSFSGTGSSDSDGTIDTYAWDFDGGSGTASGSLASYTFLSAGAYTVELTVTDDDSATDTDTQTISPAVASFTANCTDATCDFDASASSDDSGNLSYTWDFGDSSGTATSEMPSYTYSSGGTFTVILTVNAPDGDVATATQTVTVTAPPLVVNVQSYSKSVTIPQNNRWIPSVTITVEDQNGNVVTEAVTVTGTFNNAIANGTGSDLTCTTGETGTDGVCIITGAELKDNEATSVTFNVSSMSGPDITYAGTSADPTPIVINNTD